MKINPVTLHEGVFLGFFVVWWLFFFFFFFLDGLCQSTEKLARTLNRIVMRVMTEMEAASSCPHTNSFLSPLPVLLVFQRGYILFPQHNSFSVIF